MKLFIRKPTKVILNGEPYVFGRDISLGPIQVQQQQQVQLQQQPQQQYMGFSMIDRLNSATPCASCGK